jgi:hypothetical protein
LKPGNETTLHGAKARCYEVSEDGEFAFVELLEVRTPLQGHRRSTMTVDVTLSVCETIPSSPPTPASLVTEALHVVDEYSRKKNPSWISDKLVEVRADSEFGAADSVCIRLDDKAFRAIDDRLNGLTEVKGTVEP